jgi:hypothetical protein
MGDLRINKNKAIDILVKRIADLDAYDVDEKVWCSRTSQDLQTIFSGMGAIKRSHEVEALKYATAGTWKNTGKGYLNSYIDYINDHIPDSVVVELRNFEKEFMQQQQIAVDLNIKLKRSEAEAFKLDQQLKEKTGEISVLEKQIISLQNNIFQTENINALKLWNLFFNLPGKLQLSFVAFLVLVGTGGYYLGKIFELIVKK